MHRLIYIISIFVFLSTISTSCEDKTHRSSNEQMRAYYQLGCTYSSQGDVPHAIETYILADSKKDTTSATCDYRTLMLIHSEMSKLYMKRRLYNVALAESKVAEKYALLCKDTAQSLFFNETHIKHLVCTGKDSQAIEQEHILYERYKQHGLYKEADLSLGAIIAAHINQGNYDEAKRIIDIYEQRIYESDSDEIINTREHALLESKGAYYYNTGKIDSALYYCKQALTKPNGQNNVSAIKTICKAYSKDKNIDSLAHYARKLIEADETEIEKLQEEAATHSQVLHRYFAERRTAEEEHEISEYRKSINIYLTLLIIIITVTATHLRFRRKKQNEIRLKDLQIDYQHTSNMLHLAEEQLSAIKLDKSSVDKLIVEKESEIFSLRQRIEKLESTISIMSLTEIT